MALDALEIEGDVDQAVPRFGGRNSMDEASELSGQLVASRMTVVEESEGEHSLGICNDGNGRVVVGLFTVAKQAAN
jgi:hypothetical protein